MIVKEENAKGRTFVDSELRLRRHGVADSILGQALVHRVVSNRPHRLDPQQSSVLVVVHQIP